MDVIAGVFYCLGFYILLVYNLEDVLFSYSCKRVFLQIHLLFHSPPQGEGAWQAPGPSTPSAAQEPAGSGVSHALHPSAPQAQTQHSCWHCGHCVPSPGGLSSKAHGIFYCVPLSKVKKKGILNFI